MNSSHQGVRLGMLATVLAGSCQLLAGQGVLQVSGTYDSSSAPGGFSLPGLSGGFVEQILIDDYRITGLRGRSLRGFAFRRDLDVDGALKGGQIDLIVRLSSDSRASAQALERFADNAPRPNQTQVFAGRVSIPNSPKTGTSPTPWAAQNSVTVQFTSGFSYSRGTLCIELEARPVVGQEPYWWVDHESAVGGSVSSFGQSCSNYQSSGGTLFGHETGLEIGNSMRLTTIGRVDSSPILLVGVSRIPGGVDLTVIGAPGCYQFVSHDLVVPLLFAPKSKNFPFAFANLELQVPYSQSLLSAKVYAQTADLERPPKTNQAGVTTSNGLELQLSSSVPSLGMSIVRSRVVGGSQPMPGSGKVRVNLAPVLRIHYQ